MRDVSKNIVLAVMAAAIVSLSALAYSQRLQLGTVSTSPTAAGLQPSVVAPVEPEKEEAVAMASGLCPRARVRETHELNPDGSIKTSTYSVSVDGKVIAGSAVTSDMARISSVLVSGDCKRVAWVERPSDEFDDKYEYGKAQKIRTALIGSEQIVSAVLTKAGPAVLEQFTVDRLVVGIGPAIVGEADIPDEREFLHTYYAIESANGRITEVGGPFLSVSPDLRHRVRPEGKDAIVLEDSVTKKTVVLAKGEKEYATNFVFSPDSRNLAYLRLTGDRDLIFATLYRPMGLEDFPGGALFIQPVDGDASTKVIYGGYSANGWWIERWISPSKLEYSEPEMAKRIQEFDLAAPSGMRSVKKEIIDQEAL